MQFIVPADHVQAPFPSTKESVLELRSPSACTQFIVWSARTMTFTFKPRFSLCIPNYDIRTLENFFRHREWGHIRGRPKQLTACNSVSRLPASSVTARHDKCRLMYTYLGHEVTFASTRACDQEKWPASKQTSFHGVIRLWPFIICYHR